MWNPDSEGNGYHHDCLCEMEFRLRDRQIYDKGRADALDKIRAEIKTMSGDIETIADALAIIDKYKAEIEPQESEERNND